MNAHEIHFRVFDKVRRRYLTRMQIMLQDQKILYQVTPLSPAQKGEDYNIEFYSGFKDCYGIKIYENDYIHIIDGRHKQLLLCQFSMDSGFSFVDVNGDDFSKKAFNNKLASIKIAGNKNLRTAALDFAISSAIEKEVELEEEKERKKQERLAQKRASEQKEK